MNGELFRLVRGLLTELASTDVVEFSYETADLKLFVRKDPAASVVALPVSPGASASPPIADTSTKIISPLTGVFYRSPKPGSPPFVQEGEWLEAGTVVGLVEAMKVFNEIRTEEPGRVQAFFAANGDLIHKGQPLLSLEKE